MSHPLPQLETDPARPSAAGGWNGSHRRLRVCHLGKFYPPAPGGIETHLQTLARSQALLGADVRVVCVNHADAGGRDVTWKAVAATPTVEDTDGDVKVTRVGRWASLSRFEVCRELLTVLSRVQREGCDVLHLHVPNPTMLLALAVAPPKCPLVITYHSDVVKQRLLARAVRPFEHRVFRRASAILASSPTYPAGSELLQTYADKVTVVPFGIDLQPYLNPSPASLAHAERLRREHGSPLWLSVGRFVYYKGLHNAITALKDAPGKLLLIGGGPLEGELKALVVKVGVADRVVWNGRVSPEELVGAYHAATALWFPSTARSEAFGLVQVEAMASGCPVLNTAIPDSGVAWVSRHGESGLTVPVGDAKALAAAANRLVGEPGLRERLRVGGRERAVREFDQELMAERSLAVYDQMIRQPARDGDHVPVRREATV